MLKIRLMRIGGKKKPFYRVVVQEQRSKRTGGYVELLGTYNPLTEPKDIKINQDRVDYWIKQGAQLSVGYLRIIGKAPQRPPRKPKKAVSPPADEPKKEEVPAPAEESQSTEPSGASRPDEQPTGDKEEEPKNEGTA